MRRLGLIVAGLAGAVALSACSSAPSSSGTTTTTARAATTTTGASTIDLLGHAVRAYESSMGVKPSQFMLTSLGVSGVDPAWAQFSIGPAASDVDTFQGGYGYLYRSGGVWSVVGFGSAQVGCPPAAPGNKVLPADVLAGFDKSCPPS